MTMITYCDTNCRFWDHLQGPCRDIYTCHLLFKRLIYVATGVRTPNLRFYSERSNHVYIAQMPWFYGLRKLEILPQKISVPFLQKTWIQVSRIFQNDSILIARQNIGKLNLEGRNIKVESDVQWYYVVLNSKVFVYNRSKDRLLFKQAGKEI